ncbi:MAG: cell division protein ZapD [Azoarcus sp.]|nr:cell division protein ZapD [Azoarcus sp.]
MIDYEYPLNERIRILLRLEDLFQKYAYFHNGETALDHHIALLALFEILEVASRADLKVDLCQELERQRQTLLTFRDDPEISERALASTLDEIERASAGLLAMTGKIGQSLRENEWLMSIRSRAAIPGGASRFDLPAYHFWLNRDPPARRYDLDVWGLPMMPIQTGFNIVLRLLRASGRPETVLARNGIFQMTMPGRSAQMARISVLRQEEAVPEISANKYALSVRFMLPETLVRPRLAERDLSFDLTFCSL